jgi:hypothetical protein
MDNKRSPIEIASILEACKNEFLGSSKYSSVQKKAYQSIIDCRTSKLGGHRKFCNNCSHTKFAYNSCRNRHCPKCQFIKKEVWMDKLSGNLPPVKYFHLVFTIPECLNKLFYINQKEAYDLLFKAAGESLKKCAYNTDYLGAKSGAVALLHTWGQSLSYHPHIHMIVPSGGLTEDNSEWIPSSNKFFVPVKAISKIFRGILCKALEDAVRLKKIILPYDTHSFQQLKTKCYKTNWVVYSEKPFANPKNLIKYLGNYTHRVAISNQRITSFKDGKVSFTYKDYKNGGFKRVMTLDQNEFTRRFLQHVLPSGFSKIRYYGFLSLRFINENIELCCNLLNKSINISNLVGLNAFEVYRYLFNKDPLCCEKCKKGNYEMRTLKNKDST